MTLTTNGKNYIAQELGIGNCFSSSGLSWTSVATDGSTVNESGGTASIIGRLVTTSVYSRIDLTSPRVKSYTYNDLKIKNDNFDVTLADAQVIASNDGSPVGEAQYCSSGTITPTPSPTGTPTPVPTITPVPTPVPGAAVGEFTFMGAPVGVPSVSLDLSALIMRQAADYHFEMNDITIVNTSNWPVYLSMEVKLFRGSLSSCPTTGYVFDGLDRTSTKSTRIKTLAPGETGIYDTDYYQPISIIGVHTVCLLIHGTWTKAEIDAELILVTG